MLKARGKENMAALHNFNRIHNVLSHINLKDTSSIPCKYFGLGIEIQKNTWKHHSRKRRSSSMRVMMPQPNSCLSPDTCWREDVNEEMEGSGGRALVAKELDFTFAVLGDLHLEPDGMDTFHKARSQIVKHLMAKVEDEKLLPNAHMFQLGDVGGYKFQPGSAACFRTAVDFLNGFGIPRHSVTGNHDLEGEEFETDAENLAAWQEAFGQSHYWLEDFGSVVCIGLSTVRFRDAVDSCHEVFIDSQQIDWFESTLKACGPHCPVFVFSHAPPMGSGLTSLQQVHVRNRCAWLNQSEEPQRFLEITQRNPQIKLWFSGHYHLSHDYERSISKVGSCLFVQTGVMGECHRDGRRHSRVVKGGMEGYKLYTLDHESGDLRLDVIHNYSEESNGSFQRTWCSNLSYLTSCPGGGSFSPQMDAFNAEADNNFLPPSIPSNVQWWKEGKTILALNDNQLLQYCPLTQAPLGIVVDAVNGREVRLLVSPDGEVDSIELHPIVKQDASALAFAKLNTKQESGYEVVKKNKSGEFWRVFQVNKWQLRKEKEAAAAALASVAGPIPPMF